MTGISLFFNDKKQTLASKLSIKNSVSYILSIFFLTISLHSCKQKESVDVSKYKAEISIIRWDKLLASSKSHLEIKSLLDQYPAFAEIFSSQVLGLQSSNKDSISAELFNFVQDTNVAKLNAKVAQKYSEIKDIESDIEGFYQHVQHYFPRFKSIPNVYTFVSQFGYQMFVFQDQDGRDAIAIGLDMFLDPDINYKDIDPDNTNFSSYITRSWNRDHVVKKLAESQLQEVLGEPGGFKLLDIMLHNGKSIYMLSKLLPETNDTIIHEYTKSQLDWCEDNEAKMWSYFFNEKLFYESTPSKINKYISPAPFSPNMPTEAPGRTANYLGFRIVAAYMERYPKTTFEELLSLKNSQEFLEKSKYKPKR
jgi:hypothetical protein